MATAINVYKQCDSLPLTVAIAAHVFQNDLMTFNDFVLEHQPLLCKMGECGGKKKVSVLHVIFVFFFALQPYNLMLCLVFLVRKSI